MSKYYYDDALQALWMQQEFGFTFQLYFNGSESYEECLKGDMIRHFGSTHPFKGVDKYYVHPDSLPLLQPQIGDLVRVKYDSYEEIGEYSEVITIHGSEVVEIIQRQGKAFFTPKTEGVAHDEGK